MAGLVAIVRIGGQQHWFAPIPSYAYEIIFFLGICTLVIFYFLIKRSRSPAFTQAYLLSVVLKMIGYGAFILVIIFRDREGAVANALLFMVVYVLFTAFEVGFLFKKVNR